MGLRTVIGPDGRTHVESTLGGMRRDLTTGEASHVIRGGTDGFGIDTVIGPHGSVSHELRMGGTRVRQPVGGMGHVL